MDGFLLVDKPKGWTSFDVVNKIRFTLADYLKKPAKGLKVGHSGTLDPMATGLLIVLLGSYTKQQAKFMGLDKTYLATVTFGASSDTDDAEGTLTQHSSVRPLGRNQIEAALESFIGELMQTPPQYSAIKKHGKRAYALSRRGETVKLEPRPVTVQAIDIISYEWPRLSLSLQVSSGTYIRAIARDLGQKLAAGGYLSELVRQRISDWRLDDALQLDTLNGQRIQEHLRHS